MEFVLYKLIIVIINDDKMVRIPLAMGFFPTSKLIERYNVQHMEDFNKLIKVLCCTLFVHCTFSDGARTCSLKDICPGDLNRPSDIHTLRLLRDFMQTRLSFTIYISNFTHRRISEVESYPCCFGLWISEITKSSTAVETGFITHN